MVLCAIIPAYILFQSTWFRKISSEKFQTFDSYIQLQKIFDECDQNCLVTFDVDDTLITAPDVLANFKYPFWFKIRVGLRYPEFIFSRERCEWASSIIFDQARRIVFDPDIVSIIQQLRQRGCTILALTSMESGSLGVINSMPVWRAQMLKDFGIDLDGQFPDVSFTTLSSSRGGYPILYKGILGANQQPKGNVLGACIDYYKLKPAHILSFDDNAHALESIASACQKRHIPFVGYQCLGVEKISGGWKTARALVQVDSIMNNARWLTDDQADELLASGKKADNKRQAKKGFVMQSSYVQAGAVEVYTENFGDHQNPAILLISGAMAPARFWPDEFCQQLGAAGYFVIRYDHRDMGLSSAVDYAQNPYGLNDLAKDAIAILDAYKIKQAHIVGHSMGGAIAQLLALDYPSRVLSIAPISSAVLANPDLNAQEKEMLAQTWPVLMRNKPTKKFEESVDGFVHSYQYLHGDLPIDREMAANYIKDMYIRSRPEHIAWFEKFSSGSDPVHNHVKAQQNMPDRTNELHKIQVPVLVIHGQKDSLAFARIMKEYCADLIPRATMQVIPGMGHMILNKNIWSEIGEFLKALW